MNIVNVWKCWYILIVDLEKFSLLLLYRLLINYNQTHILSIFKLKSDACIIIDDKFFLLHVNHLYVDINAKKSYV